MPILKRFKPLDWPVLLMELALIFIGITAALWFDNLNQARADRRRETRMLNELIPALQSDTSDLNGNLRATAQTLASIDTVLEHLKRQIPYDTSLAKHFAVATRFTNFISNRASYEYLKSIGLNIITDDTLRIGIARYYEGDVQFLVSVEQLFVNGNWQDAVKPQMLSKFSYGFFRGEPAIPHDYDSLTRDRSFQSVLRTTGEILKWKDERTKVVVGRAEELMRRIQVELAGR